MNSATEDAAPSEGRARRARAQGRHTDKLGDALAAVDPDLLAWADGFIFGQVWADDAISFDDRMLVAIVALSVRGDEQQLRTYLHGALQGGQDPARLREALKMLVVYAGFPTAIRALSALGDVEAAHARSAAAGS